MAGLGSYFLTVALSNVFSFFLIISAFAGLEVYLWLIDADGARNRAKLDKLIASASTPRDAVWIFERRLSLPGPTASPHRVILGQEAG